ncbi:hypothetical protein ASC84_19930 [Acinetobacter sp. Root1280]|uniref:hypothetical protein n=1 Tax=Acinetobacter sp. Root1280 TaxID=1736444 RepID=UPI0007000CB9|nr:hypothetical protein [Acinetobacter sp. Root1280]KQW99761.1 hypothetical protein ASC84_19930 [Acinetobacter sp. Root1280]
MENFNYGLWASFSAIVGLILVSFFSKFSLVKLFFGTYFFIFITIVMVLYFTNRSINRGVDGDWGIHGVFYEFLNLKMWVIGSISALFFTILFMLSIIIANWGKK